MAMTEARERPLKIRKLDLTANSQEYCHNGTSAKTGLDERNEEKIDNSVAEDSNLPFHYPEETSSPFDTDARVKGLDKSQPLSKSQLKKLRKKQEWEAGREYRKLKRKEKSKEKKARKAEERAVTTQEDTEKVVQSLDQAKKNQQRPIQVPITFVLDCDFDDLMTDGEIISLSSQLTRCYSDNKSAPYRAHMVVSSFGGKLKQRFETVLASNHLAWKGVTFTEGDFVTAAREADAVMRGQRGGRLAGVLVESANLIADSAQIAPHEIRNYKASTHPTIFESTTDAPAGTSENHRNGQSAAATSMNSTSPPDGAFTQGSSKPESREVRGVDSTIEENPLFTSTLQSESEVEAAITSINAHLADAIPLSAKQDVTNSCTPSLIYLSSDSPNVLDVLSPYTTYVIGGLVDKNRHKGLCYKRACERGIPTAKLPIGEYMIIQSRTVLATNHVVEIMLRWLENGDWGKAFMSVIPKRKEARLKGLLENNGSVEHGEEINRSDLPSNKDARVDASQA